MNKLHWPLCVVVSIISLWCAVANGIVWVIASWHMIKVATWRMLLLLFFPTSWIWFGGVESLCILSLVFNAIRIWTPQEGSKIRIFGQGIVLPVILTAMLAYLGPYVTPLVMNDSGKWFVRAIPFYPFLKGYVIE